MTDSLHTQPVRSPFAPSTQWTELRLAALAATGRADAREAFENFCRRYWSAVYAVARRRNSDALAQELTQEFFLKRLIEGDELGSLGAECKSFRAWLWVRLKHFLIDEWRRRTREKNDERLEVRLEFEELEPAGAAAIEYERHYARALAERSVEALYARWAPRLARRGAEGQIELPTLVAWLSDADHRAIEQRLSIRPDNARQILHRLRSDLWHLLEVEIARTIGDGEAGGAPAQAEVRAELEAVCSILGIKPPR